MHVSFPNTLQEQLSLMCQSRQTSELCNIHYFSALSVAPVEKAKVRTLTTLCCKKMTEIKV